MHGGPKSYLIDGEVKDDDNEGWEYVKEKKQEIDKLIEKLYLQEPERNINNYEDKLKEFKAKVQKLYEEHDKTMLEIEELVKEYDDLMIGVVHRDLKLENILIE